MHSLYGFQKGKITRREREKFNEKKAKKREAKILILQYLQPIFKY